MGNTSLSLPFDARPEMGDVVLVSFPKSGRTWLRYMLDIMECPFSVSHVGAGHIGRFHFEDIVPLLENYRAARVIFMLRDPRDTVVSGYFQATRRIRCFDGDLAAFIRNARHGLEKIIRYNLLWVKRASIFQEFTLIHYEDLHRNTRSELARIVHFILGEEPDGKMIKRAVDESTFANMRDVERSGKGAALYGPAMIPGDPADDDSFKVRRGVVGGWRDYFSVEDEAFAETLFDKHGYKNLLGAVRREVADAVGDG